MIKKINVFILIAALIFVMCSCSFTGGQDQYVAPASEASDEIPVDWSVYDSEEEWMQNVSANTIVQADGITTEFIKEWRENYTVYAAYPVVDGLESLSEEIKTFAEEKVSAFENSVSADTVYEEKPELTMIYEPFVYEDTSISFRFVSYTDTGVKRNVNDADTFVFDKISGTRLALSDFFTEDTDFLSEISLYAMEKLNENEILEQYRDDSLFDAGLAADEKNFDEFVVDDGCFVFSFDPGDIAPEQAGGFQVDIPFSELEGVKDNVLKGKGAISAAAPIVLPDSLKSGENDMSVFSIDGIDPINDRVIALTFDDGPNPETTPIVLDALAAHNAKATFFMVGQNAKEYPATVKQVYDAGMEIGNHSYDHSDFYQMDYDGMVEELEKTNDVIQEATGKRPIIFRAPYGNVSAESAERYGRISIYWTIDTLDWKNRDVDMNYENAVGEAYDGAVVLMHDIHPETANSVDRIASELENRGYKMVTVSQLIQVLIARGQDPTWRLGRDAATSKPQELSE